MGALRVIDKEGMRVKELDKYETSVLTMMQMKDCRPSTSPKLEKQTQPGDGDPCEHPELYRSAVCTILYMTKRRQDLQATTRWMCKRLRNPNQKSWRQLVKTVRYIKGSRELATFMPKASKPDIIEALEQEDSTQAHVPTVPEADECQQLVDKIVDVAASMQQQVSAVQVVRSISSTEFQLCNRDR